MKDDEKRRLSETMSEMIPLAHLFVFLSALCDLCDKKFLTLEVS